MLYIVLFIVAVELSLLYFTISGDVSSASNFNVCQTDACFDAAAKILGAMDEEVDPCEDFYNFTCGNWAASKGIG